MRDRRTKEKAEEHYTLQQMVEASIRANKVGGQVIRGIREHGDGSREPIHTRKNARRQGDLLRAALRNYDLGQDGHAITFGSPLHTTDFYEFPNSSQL